MKIFFKESCENIQQMKWCWKHFSMYAGFEYETSDNILDANIIIGNSENDTIKINPKFWQQMANCQFDYNVVLNDQMYVEYIDGSKDHFSTAFYFINCLWEKVDNDLDNKGRVKFENSIWKKNGYDAPINHVNVVFDDLAALLKIKIYYREASVFLSHDIDTIYGALFEDGLNSIKRKNLKDCIKVIYQNLLFGHQWLNFSHIMNIESKYKAKSTFFWLTNKEVIKGIGENADYDVKSKKIIEAQKRIQKSGFENGLHKSLSNFSFEKEISNLFFQPLINRNHFLKYNWSNLIKELNNSTIKIDASLGYAEVYGFRNGYSMPFYPFDIDTNTVCNFIEIPLTIMDATFSRYNKYSIEESNKRILDFIKENQYNSFISVLWHNSHFTEYKYKGYQSIYENILAFCNTLKLKFVVPSEIISEINLSYNENSRPGSKFL